jgi:hypothetical protein
VVSLKIICHNNYFMKSLLLIPGVTTGPRGPMRASLVALGQAGNHQLVRQEMLAQLDAEVPGFSAVLAKRTMQPSDLPALSVRKNGVFTERSVCSDPSGGYTPIAVVKEVGTGKVLLIGTPGEKDTINPIPTVNLRAACNYYRGLTSRP